MAQSPWPFGGDGSFEGQDISAGCCDTKRCCCLDPPKDTFLLASVLYHINYTIYISPSESVRDGQSEVYL